MTKFTCNTDYVKARDSSDPENFPEQLATVTAFSHFTWVESKQRLLVCDLQGVEMDAEPESRQTLLLTDPAIHCPTRSDFGATNRKAAGITDFFSTHVCSATCIALRLDETTVASVEVSLTWRHLVHCAHGIDSDYQSYGDTETTNNLSWFESVACALAAFWFLVLSPGIIILAYPMSTDCKRIIRSNVGNLKPRSVRFVRRWTASICPKHLIQLLGSSERDSRIFWTPLH